MHSWFGAGVHFMPAASSRVCTVACQSICEFLYVIISYNLVWRSLGESATLSRHIFYTLLTMQLRSLFHCNVQNTSSWALLPYRYVVATPDLQEEDLTTEDETAILASDGVWDVVSNQDAITLIKDIKVRLITGSRPQTMPAACGLLKFRYLHPVMLGVQCLMRRGPRSRWISFLQKEALTKSFQPILYAARESILCQLLWGGLWKLPLSRYCLLPPQRQLAKLLIGHVREIFVLLPLHTSYDIDVW